MIQAVIIHHSLLTMRDYNTLQQAILITPLLPGECLGYYDPSTKVMHVEKKDGLDQEAIIEGVTMFRPHGLDVREIRYIE